VLEHEPDNLTVVVRTSSVASRTDVSACLLESVLNRRPDSIESRLALAQEYLACWDNAKAPAVANDDLPSRTICR
jgi:hypothetical protein